ncbi:MAG: hypothetical protein KJ795_09145 [Gammaproteobacteria bacterium]|nr:hypothetical protein [Gammaproteobacteria bacterium]MBU1776752.1 hypothetical protein [Gammaproteobacteria bacterium]MBU1967934.1 hypothetical protein [Gammaproteobacteria bacterium]
MKKNKIILSTKDTKSTKEGKRHFKISTCQSVECYPSEGAFEFVRAFRVFRGQARFE